MSVYGQGCWFTPHLIGSGSCTPDKAFGKVSVEKVIFPGLWHAIVGDDLGVVPGGSSGRPRPVGVVEIHVVQSRLDGVAI